MKIYNVSKKIDGLGNSDFDYEAVYASGYSAGYDDGYASARCYKNEYLTIEALEDGAFTLTNDKDNWSGFTRLNGGRWEEVSSGVSIYNLLEGDVVEVKGNIGGDRIFTPNFNLSLKSKVYGNFLSVRDGDNFTGWSDEAVNAYFEFRRGTFTNSKGLVDASNLVLPGERPIYRNMFSGCTSLTLPPKLPATILEYAGYYGMFDGCTSLIKAPELPATATTSDCYYRMFQGCTSLTEAPELPATILSRRCYYRMFGNCSSITAPPELPAKEMAERCYEQMFRRCESMTEAPELPSTSLDVYCYYGMFLGCTSLTKAPVLPAATLAENAYLSMFDGCTSLSHITCLATDITAYYCTRYWTRDVSPTGTFVKAAGMDDWPTGSNGIPEGWTVVDAE